MFYSFLKYLAEYVKPYNQTNKQTNPTKVILQKTFHQQSLNEAKLSNSDMKVHCATFIRPMWSNKIWESYEVLKACTAVSW